MSDQKLDIVTIRKQLNEKHVNGYHNWLTDKIKDAERACANMLATVHASTANTSTHAVNVDVLLNSGLFSTHYMAILTQLSLHKQLLVDCSVAQATYLDTKSNSYTDIWTIENALVRRLVDTAYNPMCSTDQFHNMVNVETAKALAVVVDHITSRRETIEHQLDAAITNANSN